jgi:hypothetical protein
MLWFWSEEETWLSEQRLVNIQLFWPGNHTWRTKMSASTISSHGVMEGGGSYNLHAKVRSPPPGVIAFNYMTRM